MSASGPSRAEPSRDATGDVIAWCKGGLSVAVAGSLGRKSVRAMGKKPLGKLGSPNGRATRHVKKTRTQLARQLMGGFKGAKSEMKWQGLKY